MVTAKQDWHDTELCHGRYKIESQLGEGGMGVVYKANDRHLERPCVVKVPHAHIRTLPEFEQRFEREIRTLVDVSHPHVTHILDVGRHDDIPFAVLQYLSGGTLDDRRSATQQADPSTLRTWLPDIAAALDFIWSHGFIHRDVKPGNILFDERGRAYLGDFGLAKVVADSSANTRFRELTATGVLLGTPGFAAPELILDEPYDGRSDQYSLAVTVYEVLSGQRAFAGNTPSRVLIEQTQSPPPRLRTVRPEISRGLSDAIAKAMSREPRERFDSCVEFAEAVASHAGDSACEVRRTCIESIDRLSPPASPDRTQQMNLAAPISSASRKAGYAKFLVAGAAAALAIASLVHFYPDLRADENDDDTESPPVVNNTADATRDYLKKGSDPLEGSENSGKIGCPERVRPLFPIVSTGSRVPESGNGPASQHQTLVVFDDPVHAVAASPDGSVVAIGTSRSIEVWQLAGTTKDTTMAGHEGTVTSLSFSPDGTSLASGSDDRTVKIWDIASGKNVATFDGGPERVTQVSYSSRNGVFLASAGSDEFVRLWDVARGEVRMTLVGHAATVTSAVVASDSGTVVSGSEDRSVVLWDAGTGEQLATLMGHNAAVRCVAVSPDGRMIVSGDDGGTIVIWDAGSRTSKFTVPIHKSSVWAVEFHPHENLVATAGDDGMVCLLNITTGKPVAQFPAHQGGARTLEFLPQGSRLASGGADGAVRIWDVTAMTSM